MKLNPECYRTTYSSYLKADGTYFPCCYTSTNPEFRTFLGEELYKQLNINTYSIEEIKNSAAFAKLDNSIRSDTPLDTCLKFCNKDKDQSRDAVGNSTTVVKEDKAMQPFTKVFKLYAYKKYDICDLSIRITDNFVLTYRLTHDEIKSLFSGAREKSGIRIKISSTGAYIYAVVKNNIQALRLTISANHCNFNVRTEILDFENLKEDYNFQMANPVAWDDYDPR